MDPVATLTDLVSLPSVNPLGSQLDESICYESRVTEYLQRQFEAMPVEYTKQSVEAGRENIIARLAADNEATDVLVLQAHQDTVPVTGMSNPFQAEIRGGRLYGRGACDVKGGMASMLTAFSELCTVRPRGRPEVWLACTVDEEMGDQGADALTRLWHGTTEPWRRPSAIIVAEPTRLDVVRSHNGAIRWECRTTGRAAHSSRPELGVNAVYRMAIVLQAIERFSLSLAQRKSTSSDTSPRISVGLVHGGTTINTVPDCCRIGIDRRLVPGESADEAREELIEYLSRDPSIDFPIIHEAPFTRSYPLTDANNGWLASRLQSASQQCGIAAQTRSAPYGSDAGRLAADGIPTVVFGPGSVEQAHTCDEWIAIDQLQRAAAVLYELIADWEPAS